MTTVTPPRTTEKKPWPALWALVVGFFMILVDSTIVSVATPTIAQKLDADINAVIWVTSAYLLAYAVPLLITGRLGDRFGPKVLYQVGLVVFTLASLWCGLSGSIEMLIVARVVQGLGAAMMTPQTMSVITRMFPPQNRGAAMGLWGATAGIASLVGPIAGGLLVDGFGWEWIFFVNVPVGVVAFVLAQRFVPSFDRHQHRFDYLGIVLSAVGMFLLVFGIQEGETYDWGTIAGPISVWALIIAGLVVLAAFVVWQGVQKTEPLLPLGLFKDRNFTLANIAITAVGVAISSFALPLMLWAQDVKDFSPTQAALLLVPMAVLSAALAPLVGKNLNRWNPRWVAAFGLACFSGGLFWFAGLVAANAGWQVILLPSALLGIANACMWGPLSVSATRNLSPRLAGAGSGVYNTTRQIGAVLGSAGIAALIEARITANFPSSTGGSSAGGAEQQVGSLPSFLLDPFSKAMGQSLILPAVVLVVAIVAALFLAKPKQTVAWAQTGAVATQPGAPEEPARAEHGSHAAGAAPTSPEAELAASDHHGRHADV
ncbi:EmrB/QacA subfamily drug resistance transporter [Curtobacterium sp. PhB130]|uniref:DHA2 family efflux MFS transporter permease subunit n=1 Tax=unclassified Curtobacterium TaxID=257496 RepID=UPI000F4C3CCF|nr:MULTISPECIES: DHA2 family efflux MFS transporter permease subunit [unclassified Curtobacterium]ROP65026.1 EmrB/QacA subfamily drug resistance transporter [Curtobacterium sp. ZW137]ROS78373.1 EmrB/QacA subfamily drug resistance transporter [Curtobacterium sp. PhB130]TCK65309.1 EmrB/QacA subfamily drug resistance transporter [Curtobacterium sp. PhB136]